MGCFVIKSVASGVKFDLRAGNGEVIATSQAYKTAAACRKGIGSVIRCAEIGRLEDLTEPSKSMPNPKFELYRDKSGQFRFRLRARNGAIIAVSEGYNSKSGCLAGVESVQLNTKNAEIIPISEK